MRAIIFLDWDNFCKSISAYDPKRKEKVSSFSNFITNYIKNIAHPEFIYNGESLMKIYKQYDGYLEGWGKDLFDFFNKLKYVNGFDITEKTNKANGFCDAVLLLIKEHKTEAGDIYLTSKDDIQEYNYIVDCQEVFTGLKRKGKIIITEKEEDFYEIVEY